MKNNKLSKILLLTTTFLSSVTLMSCNNGSSNISNTSTPNTSISNVTTTTNNNEDVKTDEIIHNNKIKFNGTLIPVENKEEHGITLDDSKTVAYTEGAYVEFDVPANSSTYDYDVSYTFDNNNYIKVENNLLRINGTSARVDLVGLTEARYKIKIVNNKTNDYAITKTIDITKDDRSGYAHWNNSNGIGAYNNDGTLKDGAIIVYVNDTNKNTVKAKVNGNVETGLVNIIKAATNANEALDIRIIGEIQTQQWNKKTHGTGSTSERQANLDETFKDVNWEETTENELLHPGTAKSNNYYKICEEDIIKYGINSMSDDEEKGITHLDGLTNNVLKDIKESNGRREYDSYYNELDVRGGNNITVEGIGTDAKIFQWGLCFNQCNSIEVKNIEFSNYTEDAIGIQGSNSDVTLYSDYWIHNCTFNKGVNNWDVCYENDKTDGDGSTDFKSAHDLTISYCRYNGTHKTALVGSGSSSYQYNVTFHHNYYNKCGSRLPFTRNTNFHIYNCYYSGSTGTNMQIESNAYAFIEQCYFDNTNKTFTNNGGVIKLYKNIITGEKSTSTEGTNINYVDSRTTPVTNNCKADQKNDYSSFDTNKDQFYYDTTNNISKVNLMNEAKDVKDYIPTVAGAGLLATIDYSMNFVETNTGYVDTSVIATYNYSDTAPATSGLFYTVLDNSSPQVPLAEANVTDSTIVKENNGKISIVDTTKEATTIGYYMLDDSKKYTTGTHTYTINLTLNGVGNSWYFLRFVNSTGDVLQIGTSAKTEPNKTGFISYQYNGETVEFASNAFTANTTYNIVLTIDYDNNTADIAVGNNTTQISNFNIDSISGIKLFTAKAAEDRSFTVNSISIE